MGAHFSHRARERVIFALAEDRVAPVTIHRMQKQDRAERRRVDLLRRLWAEERV